MQLRASVKSMRIPRIGRGQPMIAVREAGRELAGRLGVEIIGDEGHDLKCACVACPSSDAFRIHRETGLAHCYSCHVGLSRLQLAELVLGDRRAAWDLLVELGLEEPRHNPSATYRHNRAIASTGNGGAAIPIKMVAAKKGISAESLIAYGAVAKRGAVAVPMHGPDGEQCSLFRMPITGGKGKNQPGKPAGVFLPVSNGAVHRPKDGEAWCLVEGVKDAAALRDLGFLAAGLPGCRMSPRFARLFNGVNVTIIPDRDKAGEDGAHHTASALHGFAASIKIATLPAECDRRKDDDPLPSSREGYAHADQSHAGC
jgi:hypothetical protein